MLSWIVICIGIAGFSALILKMLDDEPAPSGIDLEPVTTGHAAAGSSGSRPVTREWQDMSDADLDALVEEYCIGSSAELSSPKTFNNP